MKRTIREIYEQASEALAAAGVPDARYDAYVLLEHVTGVSHARFIAEPGMTVDDGMAARYAELIAQRQKRIPLQLILGSQGFMGLTFKVDGHVLIPRPDTETLVETALKRADEIRLSREGGADAPIRILDIGTGSGCVLISLVSSLARRGACSGVGVDISEEALRTASENARECSVDDRVEWVCSDLFSEVGDTDYDLIVSNPPYIPTDEIDLLEPEVSVYDPRAALDGGRDGLDYYRRIIPQALRYLNEGGWLLVEIGYGQSDAVRTLFEENGYQNTEVIPDLSGTDRVVTGKASIYRKD